jgi:hypothetical protein
MIVDSMINKLGKSPDEIAQQAVMNTSPMSMPQQTQIPQSPQPTTGVANPQELDMQGMSADDQQMLDNLLQRGQLAQSAPLGDIGQELAMQGQGDDTELAHLTAGEVVIPPEMLEDEEFESMLEMKFRELGINPEEAVVGAGVASLNPMTGLEEFGFFKKLGKKLKKFAKKIAPVAGPLANFIPGVGPVIAGAIGAGTNLVAGKGIKGAITGALSGYGTGKAFGNIANVGGMGDAAFAKAQFGDKLRALKGGLQQGGIRSIFGNVGQAGDVISGGGQVVYGQEGLPMGMGQGQGQVSGSGRRGFNFLDDILGIDPSGKGLVGSVKNRLLGGGQGEGGGGLLGGGGLGSLLGLAGAGALAGKLGQLAFQEAKGQTGVPLTPLTTMDASGRYNIEAEIARRMGQPAPNPVEFGLLPQGTLPELSGGQPRPMAYGGGVYGNGLEDLQGGMVSGMMGGGPVMQYAQGGAVQRLQEGGEPEPQDFPRRDGPINGAGTETSDDIPAMLSDGEFVMTGRAVRGAGSYEIQNQGGIISLVPSLEEDRNRGMENMYKIMDAFESSAQPSS